MSEEEIKKKINNALNAGAGPKIARFALAALSGVIPGAGGVIGGAASAWSEKEQEEFNKLLRAWLKLQEDEIKEIGQTLVEIMIRLDQTDIKIRERLESKEYLQLLKKSFRDWSAAESEEKRRLIRNLLVNAASTKLCPDDVIKMFIEWIGAYSEAHFRVIREIYANPGITRKKIWENIYGETKKEDSSEADLFRLLIHNLSTGRVIRQHRETDYYGNFIKTKSPSNKSSYYTSAFDDERQYELTELGKQFVHYTMNEIVPRISSDSTQE